VLVKIHGDAKSREGRVLTRAEYDKYYGRGRATTPLADALMNLIAARPVLFLGCSLKKDRYLRLLRGSGLKAGRSHFALLPSEGDARWVRRRTHYLRQLRIAPIWYRAGDFVEVTRFVEWLVDSTRKTSKPRSKADEHREAVDRLEIALNAALTPAEKIALFIREQDVYWSGGFQADYVRAAQPILKLARVERRYCDALRIANNISAMVLSDKRRLRAALSECKSLLPFCRDRTAAADYHYNLASSLESSDPARAKQLYRRLSRSRRLELASASLRRLGQLEADSGDLEAAVNKLREAARLVARLPEEVWRAHSRLGVLLDDMDDDFDLLSVNHFYNVFEKHWEWLNCAHGSVTHTFTGFGWNSMRRTRLWLAMPPNSA
jgi:hypothetical protein